MEGMDVIFNARINTIFTGCKIPPQILMHKKYFKKLNHLWLEKIYWELFQTLLEVSGLSFLPSTTEEKLSIFEVLWEGGKAREYPVGSHPFSSSQQPHDNRDTGGGSSHCGVKSQAQTNNQCKVLWMVPGQMTPHGDLMRGWRREASVSTRFRKGGLENNHYQS